MKFIHLSDLHIGKRVNGYSMIEDQRYILDEILTIIDEQKTDGVIIAGDVYDKTEPSAEAVKLLDNFLVELYLRHLHVFIISGNHDSSQRIAFGGKIMEKSNIHISPVYNGIVEPIKVQDDYGEINFWLLPFIKPTHVRSLNENAKINSYTDAVRFAIEQFNIDTGKRNVMITHQFVTGAKRSESENISIGGTDNVDASVFDDFDYTALGHLHRPQYCQSEKIRYSGTPIKYSFSEAKDDKSITVVELKEKGVITIDTIPLKPKHDMVEIKGKYDDIMLRDFYKNTSYQEDYVHITLTDENDIPDAIGKLRTVYRNLMKLDYDNKRTRYTNTIDTVEHIEEKSPYELFSEFYEKQNGQPMKRNQSDFMKNLINDIWEGKYEAQ